MKNLPNVEGSMALKLDMSKAYDRIEWDFLEAVLVKFGFETHWCARVMDCVHSVTFSVLINGRPSEELSPNRGVRQGDVSKLSANLRRISRRFWCRYELSVGI